MRTQWCKVCEIALENTTDHEVVIFTVFWVYVFFIGGNSYSITKRFQPLSRIQMLSGCPLERTLLTEWLSTAMQLRGKCKNKECNLGYLFPCSSVENIYFIFWNHHRLTEKLKGNRKFARKIPVEKKENSPPESFRGNFQTDIPSSPNMFVFSSTNKAISHITRILLLKWGIDIRTLFPSNSQIPFKFLMSPIMIW